ncbi:MAG: TatD family hydrolase [Candidatus Helarchaeota archaeon]
MYFDTHCHLTLFKDIPLIISKAKEKMVQYILAVSMYYKDNWNVLELAVKSSEVIPALGIHPIEAPTLPNIEEKLGIIKSLIEENNIHVIGEIGLDRYFIKEEPLWKKQEKVLKYFLEIATNYGYTVNLHGKYAEKELFKVLLDYDPGQIIVHWFGGGPTLIKEGIERGFYFSVTPAVRYSQKMQKVVELVPLEHLLSESDGPVKYQGKTTFIGEPALMEIVVKEIARIKQQNYKDIEQVLFKTAKKLLL